MGFNPHPCQDIRNNGKDRNGPPDGRTRVRPGASTTPPSFPPIQFVPLPAVPCVRRCVLPVGGEGATAHGCPSCCFFGGGSRERDTQFHERRPK
jgi:hypothetical protein